MVIDGACSGNPGPGGWACLVRFGEHQREFSGFEHETTNNRMELEAAIGGFRALKEQCRVTVITDSQYVQLGMTKYLPSWKEKGWVKSNGDRVLNRDLWEQLDVLTQSHEVAWRWIPGHQGNPDQNRCDFTGQTPRPQLPAACARRRGGKARAAGRDLRGSSGLSKELPG
jgi:ribonuclease HI